MSLGRAGRLSTKKSSAKRSTTQAPSITSPKDWSARDWDAARILELGIGQGASREVSDTQKLIQSAVNEMHWISIVCYLERLSHIDLRLLPDLELRVGTELEQLRGYEPLAGYAAALVRLCSGDQIGLTQGTATINGNPHRRGSC